MTYQGCELTPAQIHKLKTAANLDIAISRKKHGSFNRHYNDLSEQERELILKDTIEGILEYSSSVDKVPFTRLYKYLAAWIIELQGKLKNYSAASFEQFYDNEIETNEY